MRAAFASIASPCRSRRCRQGCASLFSTGLLRFRRNNGSPATTATHSRTLDILLPTRIVRFLPSYTRVRSKTARVRRRYTRVHALKSLVRSKHTRLPASDTRVRAWESRKLRSYMRKKASYTRVRGEYTVVRGFHTRVGGGETRRSAGWMRPPHLDRRIRSVTPPRPGSSALPANPASLAETVQWTVSAASSSVDRRSRPIPRRVISSHSAVVSPS